MKKIALIVFAIMAGIVLGDPEDWFVTPDGYQEKKSSAKISFNGESGESYNDVTITKGEDGRFAKPDDWPILDMGIWDALTTSMEANDKVETVAQNLDYLITANGITVKGKDPNGNEFSYTYYLSKNSSGNFSKDSKGNIEGQTDASLANYADNKTIEWTSSGKAHLQLYGKPENAADGEGKFPMFGGSTLLWVGLKSYFDDKSIEAETVSNYKIKDSGIRIKGWDKDGENTTLATTLKSSESTTQSGYQVLARTAKDGETKFIPIGYGVGGGSVEVDDVTITTNSEHGAVNANKLSLYGYSTAATSAGVAKEPAIPCVRGSGEDGGEPSFTWSLFSSFFASSVFKKSDKTGKILLNGTSEDNKITVLAISGSGDEGQTLTSFSGDGVSVDFGIDQQGAPQSPIAQLHKFDTAPSPYGVSGLNFADSLTNKSVTISGMSVPVRYNNGGRAEVGYIPMGKLAGTQSASVDDLTIESTKDEGASDNDPDKLRIVGSKEATKGQLLKMGDNGKVEWSDLPMEVDSPYEMEEDEYPLYITAADHEKGEPAKIGISGWSTFDSPEVIYGAGNGKPVSYRFSDIKSLEADGDLRTIELTGYKDAGNYAIPFKNNEDGLGWVSSPSSGSALLTMNHGAEPTATVLGNSVETETISGKVTLNIKNFTNGGGCDTTMSDMLTGDSQGTNRERHQVLTRYSTGSGTPALHWVPMGGKVSGGGADVDDASITTNTAHGAATTGVESIYGFAQATDGQVPHKGKNNVIEWKKPSGGNALAFYGNYGDATSKETAIVVGSGSVTNAVSFASATDSNVKVKCESDNDGGVKITIGVYYK